MAKEKWTLRDEVRWIRKHGVRAWLTWATFEEGMGLVPLRRSVKFWRFVFHSLTPSEETPTNG